jgi:N6-L-threonylcarbamoyladenine synthase
LQRQPLPPGDAAALADVVASYQEAIVDSLVSRTRAALREGPRTLAVGGGVSLNSRLRTALRELADAEGVRLLLAPPAYCGDNAAMIGAVAAAGGGRRGAFALAADAEPNLDAVA